jgi:hypothetical protein
MTISLAVPRTGTNSLVSVTRCVFNLSFRRWGAGQVALKLPSTSALTRRLFGLWAGSTMIYSQTPIRRLV